MHARWTDLISDYVDGELAPDARAAFERHVAACADCAATLDSVRRVVARAAALSDEPPTANLWPGIAAAIEAGEPDVLPVRRRGRRFSFSVPQLAAAAAVVMALTGSSVWLLRTQSPPSIGVQVPAAAPGAPVGGSPAVLRTAAARPTAEQSYDAAVADLQQALVAGEGRLDTVTVRIVQKNLATIDSAVAAARAAVQADPANTYLNNYLARTMRRKLDLLRQVVALTSAQS